MKQILQQLFGDERLTSDQTRAIMYEITRQSYPDAQIAAMLTVFAMRGITVDELLGFREALMDAARRIDLSEYAPVDIVGTGGDGKNTFNISTCACFVVAGAGYRVAKHGNYGATSVSGASNVLEQHGVRFTADEGRLRRSIEQCNIAYLHAPLFNPAMKFVADVRRAMQVRTIFNLLGPLVNPASPAYQLLGVPDLNQMRLYTNVLKRLGMRFAIVTSLDGYDEISLTGGFQDRNLIIRRGSAAAAGGSADRPSGGAARGRHPQKAAAIFDSVLENRSTRSQKGVRRDKCRLRHTGHRAATLDRGVHSHGTRFDRERRRSRMFPPIRLTQQLKPWKTSYRQSLPTNVARWLCT